MTARENWAWKLRTNVWMEGRKEKSITILSAQRLPVISLMLIDIHANKQMHFRISRRPDVTVEFEKHY